MLAKDPKQRPAMSDVAHRLKYLGNLQSDQFGRGAFERTSGPMNPLPSKPEDPTEILPPKLVPDWQPINVVARPGPPSSNDLPAIREPIPPASGKRSSSRTAARPLLTPQRRAQMVAILFVMIAICIGVLITLLFVGN